jgi:hypothetical protein
MPTDCFLEYLRNRVFDANDFFSNNRGFRNRQMCRTSSAETLETPS